MHFNFSVECRRGLCVIEEIPSIDVCRIEGYNGIGKTTSLRLLQLCTNQQPYGADPTSWSTFREQIVGGRIVVKDLVGAANRIEWELDKDSWPDEAEPLGDRIGRIRIDGRPAKMRNVAELLHVDRLIGNEGFIQTLTERITRASAILQLAKAAATPKQRAADREIASLVDTISLAEHERLPDELRRLEAGETALSELEAQQETLDERLNLLRRAAETSALLEDVRGRGSELDSQIKATDEELQQTLLQKQEIERQLEEAAEQQEQSQEAHRQFTTTEKTLAQRDRRLTNCKTRLVQLAARADIDPDNSDLTRLNNAALRRLQELVAIQPQVDVTPIALPVLQELIEILEKAIEKGVGDLAILKVSESDARTVEDLRACLAERAAELEAQAPTEDSARLAEEISRMRDYIRLLSEITAAKEALDKAQADRDRTNEKLQKLARSLPYHTAQSLSNLARRRAELEEHVRHLESTKARHDHARSLIGGGHSEEALAQQYLTLCSEAEVDASRIHGVLEAQETKAGQIRASITQTRERLRFRRQEIDRGLARVREVVHILNSHDDLEWLRTSPAITLPNVGQALTEQISLVGKICLRLEAARQKVIGAGNAMLGITEALQELSTSLQHHQVPQELKREKVPEGQWTPTVRKWLEHEVAAQWEHPEIRKALFSNATEVDIDLEAMRIGFGADGERQVKSFAAFSSGEQAVAFTCAKLDQLDRNMTSSENRLIAIDEFGATIDAERLLMLSKYLRDRQTRRQSDQIVVLLPLTFSRDSLAGTDLSTVTRREQLKERGYFAEPLIGAIDE